MEENKPKTGSFALKFGGILGLVGIVFAVMLYLAGMQYEQGWQISVINVIITIGVITWGMFEFRKANNGYLKLGEAMKIGIGIALIGFIISMAYQMIFIYVIEPDFMTNVLEVRKNEMIAKNPNMTQEQVDQSVEMMKKFSGPGMMLAFGAIGSIFISAIISLITGLILKRDEPAY